MLTIDAFIESLQADTYPEEPCKLHNELTAKSMDRVLPYVKGKRVLDVGCGQGVALKMFKDKHYNAYGITTNIQDCNECEVLGLYGYIGDMHKLKEGDGGIGYGLIWARHVLEHSPIPLYVLNQFKVCLREDGILYVEVPMPGTACHHETNKNHYSVLTASAWVELLRKAGFDIIESWFYNLTTAMGPDQYASFICKPKN